MFSFYLFFRSHTYNPFQSPQVCACLTHHTQIWKWRNIIIVQCDSLPNIRRQSVLNLFFMIPNVFQLQELSHFKICKSPLAFANVCLGRKDATLSRYSSSEKTGGSQGSTADEFTQSFLYANNFLEPGYFVVTVNISVFALEAKSMEELLLTQVEV